MGWGARVGWAVVGLGIAGCDGGAGGSGSAERRPPAVTLADSFGEYFLTEAQDALLEE